MERRRTRKLTTDVRSHPIIRMRRSSSRNSPADFHSNPPSFTVMTSTRASAGGPSLPIECGYAFSARATSNSHEKAAAVNGRFIWYCGHYLEFHSGYVKSEI